METKYNRGVRSIDVCVSRVFCVSRLYISCFGKFGDTRSAVCIGERTADR